MRTITRLVFYYEQKKDLPDLLPKEPAFAYSRHKKLFYVILLLKAVCLIVALQGVLVCYDETFLHC